jgi:hypothetical protein
VSGMKKERSDGVDGFSEHAFPSHCGPVSAHQSAASRGHARQGAHQRHSQAVDDRISRVYFAGTKFQERYGQEDQAQSAKAGSPRRARPLDEVIGAA